MRWLVERTPDSFETVRANLLGLHHGCLVFTDEPDASPSLVLAPGQWLTVVPDADVAGVSR